jgi:hypothetical protein
MEMDVNPRLTNFATMRLTASRTLALPCTDEISSTLHDFLVALDSRHFTSSHQPGQLVPWRRHFDCRLTILVKAQFRFREGRQQGAIFIISLIEWIRWRSMIQTDMRSVPQH